MGVKEKDACVDQKSLNIALIGCYFAYYLSFKTTINENCMYEKERPKRNTPNKAILGQKLTFLGKVNCDPFYRNETLLCKTQNGDIAIKYL